MIDIILLTGGYIEKDIHGNLLVTLNSLNKNKRLMLYFGERDNEDFDFIFRTVISKPLINKNVATIISIKNQS